MRAASMSSSIKCLLPFQLPRPDDDVADSDDNTPTTRSRDDRMLGLYRQAVPLVQPHSIAAVKTLGTIVRDRELVKRMLQRPKPYAKELDRRPVNYESSASKPSSHSTSSWSPESGLPSSNQSTSHRHVMFMASCEKLMVTFDPQVRHTRHVKLAQIKPLLRFHGLEVNDAAFRRWEQRLPPSTTSATTGPSVSVTDFIQACQLWFTETSVIDHVRSLTTWQKQQNVIKAGKRKHKKLSPLQYDHHQSPAHAKQPPFDQLAHESEATSTFSYETYAHCPPPRSPSLKASVSAPALINAKFCSHNKPDRATMAVVTKLKNAKLQQRQRKKEAEALARQSRLQSAEIARAFTASVAMISRHVHNEEVRDHRESELESQIARTDQTRHWNQHHKAHCQAVSQDARAQRAREVCAMKALAEEELLLSRDFRSLREEVVRRNKPLFALSSSTSTIFTQPPEILAARATANSQEDYRRLARVEREHAKHMRSLQLLDYAYDRKRMLADALQPRANSAFVEVEVRDEELPAERIVQLAGDELWRQIVQQQQEGDPERVVLFVPPTNSPPAALRYFGTNRPISLPAFASNVDRNLQ